MADSLFVHVIDRLQDLSENFLSDHFVIAPKIVYELFVMGNCLVECAVFLKGHVFEENQGEQLPFSCQYRGKEVCKCLISSASGCLEAHEWDKNATDWVSTLNISLPLTSSMTEYISPLKVSI